MLQAMNRENTDDVDPVGGAEQGMKVLQEMNSLADDHEEFAKGLVRWQMSFKMSGKSPLYPAPPIASSPASQYLLPATFFANISFPQPYHGSLLKGCSASRLNASHIREKAPVVPSVAPPNSIK